MTAEEVAENCEKSITFFQQARETNQKMVLRVVCFSIAFNEYETHTQFYFFRMLNKPNRKLTTGTKPLQHP